MLIKDLISRDDGLFHLLLSDSNALIQSLAHDFPDLVTVSSIGKSFQGRDINVVELSMKEPASDSFMQVPDDGLVMEVDDDDDGKPKRIDTGNLGH